jgi:hypothetical protein
MWLGELPQEGTEPPTLEGAMTQETYLRVFIPIQPTP